MALNLIKACRAKNVDCIVAPYEADSQLAFLSLKGWFAFIHIMYFI
jgi:exonuclease-1